ncbi:MAG: preprotein translocase subunit SecG [Clostridia bacterium]|nr:preprotein translocase subunit SecG [Clostridia bacterium]
MSVIEIILASVLLLLALFLVVAIILQDSKKHGLSGAIAGGAETFFGKNKGKQVNKVLKKMTTIVSIVFAVIIFVAYLFSGVRM